MHEELKKISESHRETIKRILDDIYEQFSEQFTSNCNHFDEVMKTLVIVSEAEDRTEDNISVSILSGVSAVLLDERFGEAEPEQRDEAAKMVCVLVLVANQFFRRLEKIANDSYMKGVVSCAEHPAAGEKFLKLIEALEAMGAPVPFAKNDHDVDPTT